jgi:hypothetical protein
MDKICEQVPLLKCDKCSGMYKIFIIIVLLIVFYWMFLVVSVGNDNVTTTDILNKKIFDLRVFNELCCGSWTISHYILFAIVGYLYPTCDLQAITAGIIWELVEIGFYKVAMSEGRQPVRTAEGIEYSKSWWNGGIKDIIFNIAGFYTGKVIYLLSHKQKPPNEENERE